MPCETWLLKMSGNARLSLSVVKSLNNFRWLAFFLLLATQVQVHQGQAQSKFEKIRVSK